MEPKHKPPDVVEDLFSRSLILKESSRFSMCIHQLIDEFERLHQENLRLRQPTHFEGCQVKPSFTESALEETTRRVSKSGAIRKPTSVEDLDDVDTGFDDCIPISPSSISLTTISPVAVRCAKEDKSTTNRASTFSIKSLDSGLYNRLSFMRPMDSLESRFVHVGGQRLTTATASTAYTSSCISSEGTSTLPQSQNAGQRKPKMLTLYGSPTATDCYDWKLALWHFLECPDGGLANQCFNSVVNMLIVLSVLSPILSSTNISHDTQAALNILDTCFTSCFTFEVLIKLVVCPRKCVFLKSLYTFIDLLVIIAGWISFGFRDSNDMFVELIATMGPILRLLKISRHSAGWRLLVLSIKNCLAALLVPLYLMLLMVVFSGSLHFWIDRHFACVDSAHCSAADGPAFESIPHSMWFVIVTIATVGYGDVVPHSTLGKALASLQMVIGICYMAMPLAVIGNSFTAVWQDRHRILMREKLMASSMGDLDEVLKRIQDIFNSYDRNGSQSVEFEEFQLFIQSLQLGLSKRSIRDIFEAVDVDSSKQVSVTEFIDYIFPEMCIRDGEPADSD
jgi:voltage-gated potassium channel